jgi:hypothetical protein
MCSLGPDLANVFEMHYRLLSAGVDVVMVGNGDLSAFSGLFTL